MQGSPPRLLIVAHGTASPTGAATTVRLADAVKAARPTTVVDLCFLDVVEPRLADVLDERPTVVVPLLLSTGYHVQSDIPAAVEPYTTARVARHLGPDPLLVEALADRLGTIAPGDSVVLVGAGSSRAEAADELADMGRLLGGRLARAVRVFTLGDDVRAELASLAQPVRVATYLLAEGQFVTSLQQSAEGLATVAEPIGAHPSLVQLVWKRFDDAVAAA
ncbi:MAG TPA: CbiX/SirB N-terminal domain-containing protein [Jatrophihabitans sp.]|jgi:sirohydrochlorin ferrochelatase|nr:CbiX/SirB N-terminal domain-containing protein [Jatrophihabitans sp.]